ncbi:hypothetical protein VNI00_007607 [Paramarasmius palmivorus]|uniref:Uncharacterized protein n=1 Tax=Paramarasmius palmivorus TaxID=297713 RepID=A0AAW0D1X1_9AGAR
MPSYVRNTLKRRAEYVPFRVLYSVHFPHHEFDARQRKQEQDRDLFACVEAREQEDEEHGKRDINSLPSNNIDEAFSEKIDIPTLASHSFVTSTTIPVWGSDATVIQEELLTVNDQGDDYEDVIVQNDPESQPEEPINCVTLPVQIPIRSGKRKLLPGEDSHELYGSI